jgi:hypothetical protein
VSRRDYFRKLSPLCDLLPDATVLDVTEGRRAMERVRDLSWGSPFASMGLKARTGFEPCFAAVAVTALAALAGPTVALADLALPRPGGHARLGVCSTGMLPAS